MKQLTVLANVLENLGPYSDQMSCSSIYIYIYIYIYITVTDVLRSSHLPKQTGRYWFFPHPKFFIISFLYLFVPRRTCAWIAFEWQELVRNHTSRIFVKVWAYNHVPWSGHGIFMTLTCLMENARAPTPVTSYFSFASKINPPLHDMFAAVRHYWCQRHCNIHVDCSTVHM